MHIGNYVQKKRNDSLWTFSVKNDSITNSNNCTISIVTDTYTNNPGHQAKINLNYKKASLEKSFIFGTMIMKYACGCREG